MKGLSKGSYDETFAGEDVLPYATNECSYSDAACLY